MALSEIDFENRGGVAAVTPQTEEPFKMEANFINRIRTLVANMLSQLSRVSENDRKQVETLKREYKAASADAARMQIKIGNAAPWISAAAFTASLSQFLWTNGDDRAMVKFLSDQIPGAGNVFTSRYSAQQMEFIASRDLRNTEINMKNSKTQSESGSKQEILALFNSSLEAQKRASSAS